MIGVLGGSGFYSFADVVREERVSTPFGDPSSAIFIVDINGVEVAFMPRHGVDHQFPPHMINYRANLWALKSLGVSQVLGPCAAGSLQPHIEPGQFVFCDQYVDMTQGRADTFHEGPKTTHVAMDTPYCPDLRQHAIQSAQQLAIPYHDAGTVVVINGPRFATRAESIYYGKMGWEVINMTQYPEALLARELDMCYLNIALITDYDSGVQFDQQASKITDIKAIFAQNLANVKQLLLHVIATIPPQQDCVCHNAVALGSFH